MDLSVLTHWYTLLPAALAIRPVFAYLGVDRFVHQKTVAADGTPRFGGGLPSKVLDYAIIAVPVWVVFASFYLGPFWGRPFPLDYVAAILLGPALNDVFLASAADDLQDPPDTPEEWGTYLERKWGPFWSKVKETFTSYLNLSSKTLVVLGTILIRMSGPGTILLLAGIAVWLVLTQREWLSDVIAKVLVSYAIVNFIG